MQQLASAGYVTLTLSQAHQLVARSDWPLDRKAVVITFDDGLQDVYTAPFPFWRSTDSARRSS